MKHLSIPIVLLGLICLSWSLNAQSKIVDKEWNFMPSYSYADYEKRLVLQPEIIKQFKTTKTVFFLRVNKRDSSLLDSLRLAFRKSWNLTEIVFDDIKNIGKYAGRYDYSYILIGGNYQSEKGSAVLGGNYYLTLCMNIASTSQPIVLAKMDLFTDDNLTTAIADRIESGAFNFKSQSDDVYIETYNSIKKNWIINFTPVSLMAHLGVVATHIQQGIRPMHTENVEVEDLSQRLVNDTLYIPKRMLRAYRSKGLLGLEEYELDKDVLSSYSCPYRICTDGELYKIFVKENRGRYLFEFVRAGKEKNLFIIDTKEKVYVYKFHQSQITPSLREKDFKKFCASYYLCPVFIFQLNFFFLKRS